MRKRFFSISVFFIILLGIPQYLFSQKVDLRKDSWSDRARDRDTRSVISLTASAERNIIFIHFWREYQIYFRRMITY